jgi:serine/threonine-protein kinase
MDGKGCRHYVVLEDHWRTKTMSQDDRGSGEGTGAAPSAPTEGLPEGLLAPGQILGDRYQIRSQLGRGGMGEVWRAFDLKLRVEVALKALLPELFKDEKRREMLRREVRAAREVLSPNVCRIFHGCHVHIC